MSSFFDNQTFYFLEKMFHSSLKICDTDKFQYDKQFFKSYENLNITSRTDLIDSKYFQPSSPMTVVINELDEIFAESEEKLEEREKDFRESYAESATLHQLVINNNKQKLLKIKDLQNDVSEQNSRLVKEFVENRTYISNRQYLHGIVSF